MSNDQIVEVVLVSQFSFIGYVFVLILLHLAFLIGLFFLLPAFARIHFDKLTERHLVKYC